MTSNTCPTSGDRHTWDQRGGADACCVDCGATRYGELPSSVVCITRRGAFVAHLSTQGDRPMWHIRLDGVTVGKMFPGEQYGGRPHCSMTELVWSGKIPKDCADTNSLNYGIHFDTGPHDTLEAALEAFTEKAIRLIEWRQSQ